MTFEALSEREVTKINLARLFRASEKLCRDVESSKLAERTRLTLPRYVAALRSYVEALRAAGESTL